MSKNEVEHPDHYSVAGLECIEVMKIIFGKTAVRFFCLCNAFKYLWRCMSKHPSPLVDLKKARYYLDYMIKMEVENVKESNKENIE